MPTPTRIIVPIDDSDPQSLGLALGYARHLAENASPKVNRVVLLTHTKNQLHRTSLANHLGAPATKALLANKPVRLGDDVMLQHETMQTLRYGANNAVIIAFYAEDKILDLSTACRASLVSSRCRGRSTVPRAGRSAGHREFTGRRPGSGPVAYRSGD